MKGELIDGILFKPGQLYRTRDNNLIIVLEVSKKDIRRGLNAEKPGLYGFRDWWYKGQNRFKHKVYGKIYQLDSSLSLFRNNTEGLKNRDLKFLLN